ncbi:MAG: phosphatidylglycerophosphatase A [Alphaproteobacteria bacterium]|nr:phosphatidylglycerophosphatase A [Alphaproteobacteria bacterium]
MNAAFLLATAGGAGRLPWAPGTWGSAVAIVLGGLIVALGGPRCGATVLALAAVGLFPLGVWASARHAATTGIVDPGEVVVDEVVGQWLALLPVASDWLWYPVAFALFRVFDIWKPWPCRQLEKLPGGVGIMADDIAAGAWAGLCVLALTMIFGSAPTLPFAFG